MPGRIEFDLLGTREMQAVLKQLGPAVAGRVADAALRAGARPIVAEAKRLVPRRTGALGRSITAAIPRGRRRQRAAGALGDDARLILIGFKPPHSRRAHLAEFGWKHAAAQPFIDPALESRQGAALDAMGAALAAGIEREAHKLAGR
jgi:HK97 gp10 family phage protein